MHGGVGRGKSFLMDCFFQAVPLTRKTRLHFHEFMREVHRELQDLKGTADPLDELGQRIARRYRLICFDEFHVADVTDAMILHRLLAAMFANRVSIVTTSNFHPDELYPNGLHRDRILPAIELLKDHARDRQRRRAHRLPARDAAATAHVPPAAGAAGRRGDAARVRAAGRSARRRSGAAHRAARAARAAPRRRRGLVRLQDAVRRAAFAERLPRAGAAVPHRAAVGRAADAAAPGQRGAPLHAAGRRALRPPRQADRLGRRAAGAAVRGRAAGARVSAHGVAAARNAVGRATWRSSGATSRRRSPEATMRLLRRWVWLSPSLGGRPLAASRGRRRERPTRPAATSWTPTARQRRRATNSRARVRERLCRHRLRQPGQGRAARRVRPCGTRAGRTGRCTTQAPGRRATPAHRAKSRRSRRSRRPPRAARQRRRCRCAVRRCGQRDKAGAPGRATLVGGGGRRRGRSRAARGAIAGTARACAGARGSGAQAQRRAAPRSARRRHRCRRPGVWRASAIR